MKLNEKIYYCRKKAGMSQEVLAEHIGVSRQAISKWENSEAEPEIKKLRNLANVFNVTLDWFLSDSDIDIDEEKTTEQKTEVKHQYQIHQIWSLFPV